jgi:hypothetical protein
MTQQRIATARKYGRHPAALAGHDFVPDRIHPEVDHMKAPACDSPLDGATGQPDFRELRTRDNAVLPPRNIGGRSV